MGRQLDSRPGGLRLASKQRSGQPIRAPRAAPRVATVRSRRRRPAPWGLQLPAGAPVQAARSGRSCPSGRSVRTKRVSEGRISASTSAPLAAFETVELDDWQKASVASDIGPNASAARPSRLGRRRTLLRGSSGRRGRLCAHVAPRSQRQSRESLSVSRGLPLSRERNSPRGDANVA